MSRNVNTVVRYGVRLEKPQSINTAPDSRILSVPLLTEDEKESILDYRYKHGPISDLYELIVAADRIPDRIEQLYRKADFRAEDIPELKRAIQQQHLSTQERKTIRKKEDLIDDVDDVLRVLKIKDSNLSRVMNLGFTFSEPTDPPFDVKAVPGEEVDLAAIFRDNSGNALDVEKTRITELKNTKTQDVLDSDIRMTRYETGVYAATLQVPADAEEGFWSYVVKSEDKGRTIEKELTFEVVYKPEVSGVTRNNVCVVFGKIPGFEPDKHNKDYVSARFLRKEDVFAPFTNKEIISEVDRDGRFTIELLQGADARIELPQDSNDYYVSIPKKPAVEFSSLVEEEKRELLQ